MIKITPVKKIKGRVVQTLQAMGDNFVSASVDRLQLTFEGIPGDFHSGYTRDSGGREPWYPRGTQMRNESQVSINSVEELGEIASAMNIEKIDPAWIGSNIVLEGIPNLSYLPSRTQLFFEGGVTIRVDGYRGPCRFAGGSIAEHVGVEPNDGDYTRTDLALSFVPAGEMKRGLVAWVEKEGVIEPGETVTARIWDQWIY